MSSLWLFIYYFVFRWQVGGAGKIEDYVFVFFFYEFLIRFIVDNIISFTIFVSEWMKTCFMGSLVAVRLPWNKGVSFIENDDSCCRCVGRVLALRCCSCSMAVWLFCFS
jgi:hypothetical protein